MVTTNSISDINTTEVNKSEQFSDLIWKFNNLNSTAKVLLGKEINGKPIPFIPVSELTDEKWQKKSAVAEQSMPRVERLTTEEELAVLKQVGQATSAEHEFQTSYNNFQVTGQKQQYAPTVAIPDQNEVKINWTQEEELPYSNYIEEEKENSKLGTAVGVGGLVLLLSFLGWNYFNFSQGEITQSTSTEQSINADDDVLTDIGNSELDSYLKTIDNEPIVNTPTSEAKPETSYQPKFKKPKAYSEQPSKPKFTVQKTKSANPYSAKPTAKPIVYTAPPKPAAKVYRAPKPQTTSTKVYQRPVQQIKPNIDPSLTYISGVGRSIPQSTYNAASFPVEISKVQNEGFFKANFSPAAETSATPAPVFKTPFANNSPYAVATTRPNKTIPVSTYNAQPTVQRVYGSNTTINSNIVNTDNNNVETVATTEKQSFFGRVKNKLFGSNRTNNNSLTLAAPKPTRTYTSNRTSLNLPQNTTTYKSSTNRNTASNSYQPTYNTYNPNLPTRGSVDSSTGSSVSF